MDKKIGFIGCGNMAKAIINGLLASEKIKAENILIYDHKPETNQQMADQLHIIPAQNAAELASQVDILIGAVKPGAIMQVFNDLNGQLHKETLVISIAAGITLKTLANILGHDRKILRVMPNTPALVFEGMTSVTPNTLVTQQEVALIVSLFNCLGKTVVVSEPMIDAVVGVSGSSPAYIFMLIEAMADAAVLGGMPRSQAYMFAAQAVKGAAEMVLKTGKHPAELKDMVCSPAGTTIEAVKILESRGFRAAIIEAMAQCMAKSAALSKN